eukprot:CAMPEP_0176419792 /NCGR_PEP_ID=MMETSP0127-20121128/8252_1 /TAXON_ID=938130 /ORGANISM="Platyophrya macrostoma, Strain WH" /LENGTH=184 /DNA_ID=CAMNT_0017800325 /DNA_START=244 /DNA_END=798 /DNA_ORIENTATION=+
MSASVVSAGLIALVLTIAYGIVLPRKFQASGKYYTETTVRKDFADIKNTYMSDKKHFWLATQKDSTAPKGEKIVGCVLVEPYNWKHDEYSFKKNGKDKEMGEVAELRRMSVDKNIRGKGIGFKLGSELKKFCKEKGYNTVVLSTLSNNYPAITLYEKLGFRIVDYFTIFMGAIVFRPVIMVLKL